MNKPGRAAYEDKVYRDVWDGGPYTNFDMLRYLIGKTRGRSEEEKMQKFLLNPGILQTIPEKELNQDWKKGVLNPLFAGRTGLCTSFAIKVVNMLRKKASYDFVFFDLGIHRLAVCQKSKLVIDSSVRSPGTSISITGKKWEIRPRSQGSRKLPVRSHNAKNQVCAHCTIQNVQWSQNGIKFQYGGVFRKPWCLGISKSLQSFQFASGSFVCGFGHLN